MCTFFSCKAIVPVHENLILIAYAINIKLGYIKLGLIFGLSLHLNPCVLCAM